VLRPSIRHQEPVGWPLSDHADRREKCVTALTLEEARERSRLLDVCAYRVELDVTGGGEAFGSVTVVRFGCRAPGAGSFIELSPARLRRAVLNGREVDPATLTGNRLPLRGLRETNELRVEADMPYSRTGAGLHRFTDTADGETYLALHGGLDNAQRVFAAFDQPDLKAPVTVAGERCLETGALTGSLRRLLADQVEDLRRSAAVRSAY
jgi:aminopeptidase N